MFPLLLSLARRFPIISNIIEAFEGGKGSKGSNKRRRDEPRPAAYPKKRVPKQYYPEF